MRVLFYEEGSDNNLFFKDYLDFIPRRSEKIEYGDKIYKVLDVNHDMKENIIEIYITEI
jgi:hypothetical protein